MARKLFVTCMLIICFLALIACGGLRFSQVDPAAKDFHPQRIAILTVDVGPYEEAREAAGKIVADLLMEKKWFSAVIDTQSLNRQISASQELREAMMEYLSKLKTLNYSDPSLTRKIGELTEADAFLMISIDIWQYTVENDKKVAKVSMGMRLYEASTGQAMWRAGHHRAESYILIKPELTSVARKVARDMVGHMPR